MKSSRWIAAILVAAAVAVVVGAKLGGWGDKRPDNLPPRVEVGSTPSASSPAATPSAAPQTPATPIQPAPQPPTPVSIPSTPMVKTPAAVPPPSPDSPPTTSDSDLMAKEPQEIDKISTMLRDYRTLMVTNPVGSNAEIMASIIGGNPKKARLGPPEGLRLNEKGELIDAWGTPYFFHQMSAMNMEITSAGPDRKFGTSDDIKGR